MSEGTLRALDIARSVDSQKNEIPDDSKVRQEKRKLKGDVERKVKEGSRIVVVAPEGGKTLTVIDGVHRAIRLDLYHFVRKRKSPAKISQPAYLGITPDPIERSAEQWKNVEDFFL
jgi:hypothetical protein